MSRQVPHIPTEPWQSFEDIDWRIVAQNYFLQAEECLRLFSEKQNGDPVYGLILQLSQNWVLEVHLNTVSGKEEIASIMRDIASGGGTVAGISKWTDEMTDAQLLARTGFWYHPTWKYKELGSKYGWVYREVDDFQHECFERLSDSYFALDYQPDLERKEDRLGWSVCAARTVAAVNIIQGTMLAGLLKTPDFRAYIVNDDGLIPLTHESPGPPAEWGGGSFFTRA